MRVEPPLSPRSGKKSKRATPVNDNSIRASTNLPSNPSVDVVEPAPATVSQTSVDSSVSDTIIAGPPKAASTPVPQVGTPATQTVASAAASNTAPATVEVTTEATSTEPAAEPLDDKGEHLLAAFDRSIAHAEAICENLLNEFNAIRSDLKELRASKGKLEDRQKQLQSISTHWMLKVNTAKSVGTEMKVWATKKLNG